MTIPKIIPPHDVDAERDYLSQCLLLGQPSEILATDFWDLRHQRIAQALDALHKQDAQVWIGSVRQALKNAGTLQEAGGLDYLMTIWESAPVGLREHMDFYGRSVQQTVQLRRLMEFGGRITAMCGDPGAAPDEIGVWAQHELRRLMEDAGRGGADMEHISEILPGVMDRIETVLRGGQWDSVKSGIHNLDDITTGFEAGQLVIVMARPSVGKTAFAVSLAVNMAVAGHKVLFCSLEMSREQIGYRLLSQTSGLSYNRLRRGIDLRMENIQSAQTALASLPIDVVDRSISEVELGRIVADVQPAVLILDYLQLMRSARKHESREREVSYLSATLKRLAKDAGIPVVVLCQLNREVTRRADPRPTLNDCRESGAIEQDCDIMVGLYRNSKDPQLGARKAEAIVLKQRNGPVAKIVIGFDPVTMRFYGIRGDG